MIVIVIQYVPVMVTAVVIMDKTITYIGVMAQELLGTKYESALNTDSNGYYFVDYSQLPVNFKRG